MRNFGDKVEQTYLQRSSALRPLWTKKVQTLLLSRNKTDAKQT